MNRRGGNNNYNNNRGRGRGRRNPIVPSEPPKNISESFIPAVEPDVKVEGGPEGLAQAGLKEELPVTGTTPFGAGNLNPNPLLAGEQVQQQSSEEGVKVESTNPADVKQELSQEASSTSQDVGEGTWSQAPDVDMSNDDVTVTDRHPRLKLNELEKKAVVFTLVQESGSPQAREYQMQCEVAGQTFLGVGRSKKLSMADAAQKALLTVYRMRYEARPEDPFKAALKRKADSSAKADKSKSATSTEDGATAEAEGEGGEGEDSEMLGKRSPGDASSGSASSKKKRRLNAPPTPKNALMHLNELKPGSQFKFVSQTGPVHAPVFVMSVEVNGQVFEGSGSSKKQAKHQAAEAALKSTLQYLDVQVSKS